MRISTHRTYSLTDVSAEELDTIADGLRTVRSRYDMPNNRYLTSIDEMLDAIDKARGYEGVKRATS